MSLILSLSKICYFSKLGDNCYEKGSTCEIIVEKLHTNDRKFTCCPLTAEDWAAPLGKNWVEMIFM